MTKTYDEAFRVGPMDGGKPLMYMPQQPAVAMKNWSPIEIEQQPAQVKSDGSTASYYELPSGATELQHLISHRDMNAQIGEIFRACYRYGRASHSDKLRDAKKIRFYADAEIQRLNAIIESEKK